MSLLCSWRWRHLRPLNLKILGHFSWKASLPSFPSWGLMRESWDEALPQGFDKEAQTITALSIIGKIIKKDLSRNNTHWVQNYRKVVFFRLLPFCHSSEVVRLWKRWVQFSVMFIRYVPSLQLRFKSPILRANCSSGPHKSNDRKTGQAIVTSSRHNLHLATCGALA